MTAAVATASKPKRKPRATTGVALDLAVEAYRQAGLQYAELLDSHMKISAARSKYYQTRMTELIGTLNGLTAKPHSFSSAEKAVEADDTYRELSDKLHASTVAKTVAFVEYQAAYARLRYFVPINLPTFELNP